MSICCVSGCEGPKHNEVYFDFPTSRLLRKRWLDAIGASKVPPDSRICRRHFAPGDYELVRGKTRLKGKVVPSLMVDQVNNADTETLQDSTETAESDSINTNKRIETNKDDENDNNENDDNEKDDNEKDDNEKDDSEKDDSEKDNNENENNDASSVSDDNSKSTKNKDNVNNTEKSEMDNQSLGNCDQENGRNNDFNNKCIDHTNDKENSVNNVEEIIDVNKIKGINESRKNRKETSRRTRFKVTPKRVITRKYSSDSTNSSSSVQSVNPQPETIKEDIEGILTHYYIENKKTERQVAAMTDALQCEQATPDEQDSTMCEQTASKDPVYIELSVGNDATDKETSNTNDCLMVLESVQCEVDPAMLLAAAEMDQSDTDDDPVEIVETSKPDPISLLTSSDEDDVILEEPHIDTVDVSSSETDEDDVPLVKLVNTKLPKTKTDLLTKLLWNGSDYYCAKCRFTTLSSTEYTKHMHSHLKVMQVCQDCGFTTASKAQLNRHMQKHKNEKRYKCFFCNYSAKHNMSLMYHMRTHKNSAKSKMNSTRISYKEYKKKVKVFKSAVKSDVKKYSCLSCEYKTDRRSDLRRHTMRRHQECADDEEYVP